MPASPGKLALLGGILINLPDRLDDHFCPLIFQLHESGKRQPLDLMAMLRCASPPHHTLGGRAAVLVVQPLGLMATLRRASTWSCRAGWEAWAVYERESALMIRGVGGQSCAAIVTAPPS